MLVNNSCLSKSSAYMPKISYSQKPLTFKSQDAFEKAEQKPESNKAQENSKNPVNKIGEFFLSLSKTFYTSLGASSRMMMESAIWNTSDDAVGNMAMMGALTFAGTYIMTLPKNIYNSTINYVKDKETMDVFLGSHELKRDIYKKEKEELKNGIVSTSEASTQLMKMKTAKIQCPKFAEGTLAGKWFSDGFNLGNSRYRRY